MAKQIQIIEAILLYFETGDRPKNIKEGEPIEIYDMIDKLKSTPDKYLAAYRGFIEWKQPLLQRTTVADGSGKPELKFD